VQPWPVLLLARELDIGGSERQLTEIAKALDRSRFEPYVGCFRPDGMRAQELRAAGIPIVHFPVYSFASPATAHEAYRFARYVRRHGIRLVHSFDYPLTAFAIPVARCFTSAVAVSSQRSHRDLIPCGYRRIIRLTDTFADAIVVNCEFLRRHLENDEGVPPENIRVSYNGVDSKRFHGNERDRYGSSVGVVAALRPEKDIATLIEAFAHLQFHYPVKLFIVGSGPELGSLQTIAEEFGISQRCVFAPATSKVADWMHAIDIFVLPSVSEALSNSLMEAMACGCCPVATNVGGNPELIHHCENGFLFEPGDVAGLCRTLEILLENEALRHRIAACAQASVRERFSLEASARRMAEIYTGLIERHDCTSRPN